MDQDMKDVIEALTYIRDNMVTKGELPDTVRDIVREELEPIHSRLSNIEAELRSIRERLDLLEEAVASMKGYAKEIDELRGRVRDIERRLGLTKSLHA